MAGLKLPGGEVVSNPDNQLLMNQEFGRKVAQSRADQDAMRDALIKQRMENNAQANREEQAAATIASMSPVQKSQMANALREQANALEQKPPRAGSYEQDDTYNRDHLLVQPGNQSFEEQRARIFGTRDTIAAGMAPSVDLNTKYTMRGPDGSVMTAPIPRSRPVQYADVTSDDLAASNPQLANALAAQRNDLVAKNAPIPKPRPGRYEGVTSDNVAAATKQSKPAKKSNVPIPKSAPNREMMGIYRIKKGDTLSKIAKSFNMSVEELAAINNIKNPNRIYAGDTIRLTS